MLVGGRGKAVFLGFRGVGSGGARRVSGGDFTRTFTETARQVRKILESITELDQKYHFTLGRSTVKMTASFCELDKSIRDCTEDTTTHIAYEKITEHYKQQSFKYVH